MTQNLKTNNIFFYIQMIFFLEHSNENLNNAIKDNIIFKIGVELGSQIQYNFNYPYIVS